MPHVNKAIASILLHLESDKEWDEFWNITTPDDDSGSYFTNYPCFSGVICTGYACEIYRRLPRRTSIYGFHVEDNPDSEIGKSVGGHDFAIVDNRYIVDPWATGLEGLYEPMALDIRSKRHTDLIEKQYGSISNWSRFTEKEIYNLLNNKTKD